MNGEHVLLDTSKIEEFISHRNNLLERYRDINERFNEITQRLINNHWQGDGARAFAQDAQHVRYNIGSIAEVLRTMWDTLQDCLEIIENQDRALGSDNTNLM